MLSDSTARPLMSPRRGSLPPPGTPYRSLHLTSHRLDSALMLDELRIAVVIPAYNEARRLGHLIPAIPRDLVDEVIVVNDQSTDGTAEVARELGAYVIDREERGGPGPGIRSALDVLRNGEGPKADVVVVMAANGKHDPDQIIDPLRPKITDATGGYQAYRLSVLDDPTIDLHQPWLGRYEVETYLMAKTLLRGYKWKEVPVNITYPETGTYTRARAIVDWWGYFRPIVLVRLGLKH